MLAIYGDFGTIGLLLSLILPITNHLRDWLAI